jgi:hypothetical protein
MCSLGHWRNSLATFVEIEAPGLGLPVVTPGGLQAFNARLRDAWGKSWPSPPQARILRTYRVSPVNFGQLKRSGPPDSQRLFQIPEVNLKESEIGTAIDLNS